MVSILSTRLIADDPMESSKLEILIPKDTEVDFEHVLANGDGLEADSASLIEQRTLLYFGTYCIATWETLWSYSFLGP